MRLDQNSRIIAKSTGASKSSFFSGMRILPKKQREAIYLVYDFCRSVDDIADSQKPKEIRLTDLNIWRSQIVNLYNLHQEGELTRNYFNIIKEYNLKIEDFLSVIEGMEMDVENEKARYDWNTLDKYCDCVASAVGRLSTQIFGIDETKGKELSHNLGRAFQLTNILRDIDEDAGMGRFYLPREELIKKNIFTTDISEITSHVSFSHVCLSVAKKAEQYFDHAEMIMNIIPRSRVKSPRIMSAAYKMLLQRLIRRGWDLPRNKISTPKTQILLAIIKYGFI